MTAKKKDDELPVLTILAGLFTGVLIWIDCAYSSIGIMAGWLQAVIWLAQIGLAAIWVVVFAKWQDPNYEKYRVVAFLFATALMLTIGIHHAIVKEDEQVIIDSHPTAMINKAEVVGPTRVYLDGVLVDTIWDDGPTTASTLPPLIPHTAESRKYLFGDEWQMSEPEWEICTHGYPMVTPPNDGRYIYLEDDLNISYDSMGRNDRYLRMVAEYYSIEYRTDSI